MTSIDQKIKALRKALADLGQDTRQWTDSDLVVRVLSGGPSRLPAWADKPWADRLDTLRAEHTHEGTDATGLSDPELLGLELNRAWAEAQRHANAYSSLLQDRERDHRAVRTAARQGAVADVTAQAGLYLQAIIRRNASHLEGVVYRAEQIPEDGRMPVQAARELREAALRSRWMLRGLASSSALADAGKDEGVQALETVKTELRRVVRVVRTLGRELHTNHGRTTGSICECVGCELIRSVHDIPEEGSSRG
jgi:hypothetical protein